MAWVFDKKRVVVPEGLWAFGNTRLQVLRSLFLINSLTEIDSVEIGYGPGLHNHSGETYSSRNPDRHRTCGFHDISWTCTRIGSTSLHSGAEILERSAERNLVGRAFGNTPVGFALVEMLAADLPHLEEIDVTPAHGRRGLVPL